MNKLQDLLVKGLLVKGYQSETVFDIVINNS